MAYPANPQIETSYTAHAQGQGDNSFPGAQLDADLANLKTAIEAWTTFAKRIQRSDGALANQSVNNDQLGPGVLLGLDPPSDWATATAYEPPDTVYQGLGFYVCRAAHTSGDFAEDLASGRWELLIDLYEATAAQAAQEAQSAAETAQGLAEDAQTAAEAARDAAIAAANTIVQTSVVPVYATAGVVEGVEVPVEITALQTFGKAAIDDLGGGLYAEDPTPGPGGITDDGARTFKLVSDMVSLETFGGVTADLNTYLAAQLAAGRKVFAPVYHPARGLRISEFLTTDAAFTDQAAALQDCVDAYIDDARYVECDLEGRYITVADTIVVDAADIAGAHRLPRTFRNGTIAALTPWSALDKPILRLTHSTGGLIQRINFEDVHFRCPSTSTAGEASGVLIDKTYSTIRFRRCDFVNPAMFAIKCRPTLSVDDAGQSNLRIEFCDVISPHTGDMAFGDRTLISFDLWGAGDAKIIGNRSYYHKIALQGSIGSTLVQGNHFWAGRTDGGPYSGYNPNILMGARPNAMFVGNYIDNGHVEFRENLHGEVSLGTQGYCAFVGNIFTMADSAEEENFIIFRPTTDDIVLANLKITNNQFRVGGNDAEVMTEPFKVIGAAGGSLAAAAGLQNDIRGNYFWGDITAQTTHPEARVTTSAGVTSYPVDVLGKTAFGLQANYVDSIAVSTGGAQDCGNAWYQRTNGYQGNIRLTAGVNGNAKIVLDCNVSNQSG